MVIIAPVILGIVLFYWFAFCFTIWAWLQAIFCLCQCKFIRASIWFVSGTWLLLWWFDKPHDWEHFGPGAILFIGVGLLGTLVRYQMRRKGMLAAPAWTTPVDAVGNIVWFVKVTTKVKREH